MNQNRSSFSLKNFDSRNRQKTVQKHFLKEIKKKNTRMEIHPFRLKPGQVRFALCFCFVVLRRRLLPFIINDHCFSSLLLLRVVVVFSLNIIISSSVRDQIPLTDDTSLTNSSLS